MLPLSALLMLSLPAQVPPPQDLTLPPETAQLVTILEGRGFQVFHCAAEGNRYTWTLTGPDAQLFNLATGKQVGRHGTGPTWTLDDGSSIRGTVLARKPADNALDAPWLLLQVTPASTAQGGLSSVNYVRRYNTEGGVPPPAGCDAAHTGVTTRIPYTATYAFYTNLPSPQLTTHP